MVVFVVWRSHYVEDGITGIFTTRELALSASLKDHPDTHVMLRNEYVDEFVLDEFIP